jgi:NhaP-type Na+/H+ and K+/H+ antiporter
MKSRVNLYLPEYQPKLELMTLGAVLALFLFLIVLVIGARVYLAIDGATEKQNLQSLQVQIQNKSNLLEQLKLQLEQRKEDPLLTVEFENLQVALQNKERIKAALQDREVLKSASFAMLLRDLAEQHEQSLWLTRINVTEDSMLFNGEAVRPEAVPRWISRLGNTEYFAGKSFDQAELNRDEDTLTFSLKTSRNGDADTQGASDVQ